MTCLASPPIYWVDFDFWIFSFESFISRSRLSTSILATIILVCITDETKKKCTLFELKCKSTNWWHLMFMSPDGHSTTILSDHLNHMKVPICRQKSVPSFFSYFNTLGFGPRPGIETQTPCSAVKRSTDWAYPAAVKTTSASQPQNPCTRIPPVYQVLSMPHGLLNY